MVIHVTIFFTYPYSDIIVIMLNRIYRKYFLPVPRNRIFLQKKENKTLNLGMS